jgi:2-C-methyl-D-erythritol 2,4-cyclodiphosphate synthase
MTRPLLPRTGIGYDVHRFQEKRRLVLGGVEIAHTHGLAGHSDADVLLHAIADALLGAVALGDIGQHFPPDDPHWRDMDSREIVTKAVALLREAGYGPVNIDATVIAEVPKLLPHATAMRRAIAGMTGLDAGDVSLKATTNEQMGFVGRREGIAAIAVATVAPLTALTDG